MEAPNAILALNGGSSSLKFALYQFAAGTETLLARGEAEEIGLPQGRLQISGTSPDQSLDIPCPFKDHGAALVRIQDELTKRQLPKPVAVGHRFVNGGPDYSEPQRITPEVLARLRALVHLAPLHTPTELRIIDAVAAHSPGVPQVACFDTAFHRRMPELAQRFPLPRTLWEEGVRRYGFHGLSYEYIVEKLGALGTDVRRQRIVIAHLGNGASLAAVRDGRSVDTTMGLTPTGGVMMGTRTGDLDPGVLLYLLREKHYDSAKIEHVVDHESGLLGVSETSSDMKTLLDRSDSDPRARLAVEMFCYSVRKQIGALAAVLGGLDALVFAGGIGERSATVRARICDELGYLGARLDPGRNTAGAELISAASSACTVRVIVTNEELMIARHVNRLLFAV
jgi:acetate kinase